MVLRAPSLCAGTPAGAATCLVTRAFTAHRRQAPQLELGMAAAYGHEHDRAKFSQAEVDARIKER